MRFVSIIGARPQFVKAAALTHVLRREHDEFLLHSGQHYDDNMSAVFFREMGIPPADCNLGVGSGPHGAQTAAMLAGIERVLVERRPDAVIVYGDTNSTLAGALAAAKLNIPVAHVEAGLRSFNRAMPEEINRIVADHVARWLLAPAASAVAQLAAEGVTAGVFEVGDIMADCVRQFAPVAARRSDVLRRFGLRAGEYCVATVHRAGNTDDPRRLQGILGGLCRLRLPVILPMHPRTRAAVARCGLEEKLALGSGSLTPGRAAGRVTAVEPLGYLDMLQLQRHAAVVLTDSGGMQKEAYYLGVPCVTLREETEWVETVAAGWNRLCGADPERIVAAVDAATACGGRPRPALYGDGRSAERIVQIFERGTWEEGGSVMRGENG